jgi:hypothetical protein
MQSLLVGPVQVWQFAEHAKHVWPLENELLGHGLPWALVPWGGMHCCGNCTFRSKLGSQVTQLPVVSSQETQPMSHTAK